MAKKYWFKAKKYGWGWYPASKEGWIIIATYIATALLLSLNASLYTETANEVMFGIFPQISLLTIVLIFICYKKGEKPYWSWGDKNAKKTRKK